ncbi:hypothetical protein G3570_07220 [Balneolaceae bacterium YR4-1]|uniref:peptidylprolyl isomerase n=1 Tax=Halalkalibaculum roseum TaxID=2709311 RepID=A0A6M1SWH8_9BACT|nr:peptidyl-prolyl cis-trans isomerase [Halalkalibaculum roseum]NGP76416.1 hypothetical protein [Halalkalibaculum roseum]
MNNSNATYSNLFIVVLLAIFLFSACTSPQDGEEIKRLARVGNEYLTLEHARTQIPDFMLQQDSIGALQTYRERWIENRLMLQEAERLQLRQDDEVQAKIQHAQQEVLTQALKDAVISDYEEELVVTDEEARNYYQAHKDQFVLNERFVQFRHLIAEDIESARAAKRELMQAVPWPEVARKYSINAEAKITESEQFWPISMAASDIEIMNRYLNIIGQSEISPIQRVNGNYHFVQLMESRAEGEHPDLDWLMEQIKDWLLLDKRRRHFSSYVKNLYLKAQSNNEVDTFNVLQTNYNTQPNRTDTLQNTETNE